MSREHDAQPDKVQPATPQKTQHLENSISVIKRTVTSSAKMATHSLLPILIPFIRLWFSTKTYCFYPNALCVRNPTSNQMKYSYFSTIEPKMFKNKSHHGKTVDVRETEPERYW